MRARLWICLTRRYRFSGNPKKRTSLIEVWANIGVGMIVSYLIQLVLFPDLSHTQQFGVLAVFTAANKARGYFMRRLFNWLTIRALRKESV